MMRQVLPPSDRILTWLLDFTKRVGEDRDNHPVAERVMAWTTVGIFTIRYMVDYIRLRMRIRALRRKPETWWSHPLLSLIPLARTRAELQDVSFEERWRRLKNTLEELEPKSRNDPSVSNWSSWTDEEWIEVVHSSLQLRRELSYCMYKLVVDDVDDQDLDQDCRAIMKRMKILWPRLLPFPGSLRHDNLSSSDSDCFSISVIVPMYKEPVQAMQKTLGNALTKCGGNPQRIQIILVCADPESTNASIDKFQNDISKQQSALSQQLSWGDLLVVGLPSRDSGTSTNSAGRGRTLNAGIPYAKAPILTFLHADTLVPQNWDVQIQKALTLIRSSSKGVFPQACAFTMGIDMSSSHNNAESSPSTSALMGAQWQGMLRCHCGLPYGDSVLSFAKATLNYLGGYPEQPLMEDFELMDWLRVRSMLLHDSDGECVEQLKLLHDQAHCSPRRWKRYGVAYTSLVNAICIYRYRHKGVFAEDLFNFYYLSGPSSDGKLKTT